MNRKRNQLKPKFKLWLSSRTAEGVFGDGKWRLLKAVKAEGSLRAAAESLGISYRKAWGDIKKAEIHLGTVLVEKHHGGRKGGSTKLTSAGKSWVKAYSEFRAEIERAATRAYGRHIGKSEGLL